MPFYRMGQNMVHLNIRGKKAPPHCCARIAPNLVGKPEVRCNAIGTFLCDWPVEGGTCDAPLCDEHGTEVAKNRHYCPRHLAEHRVAQTELW